MKASELAALRRLYRRRVPPESAISHEVAASMAALSHDLGVQIGLLISRKGSVEHVVVGSASRIAIPDTGRYRAAQERLRGLRFVHTHIRGEPLDEEDLTDLLKLRLDHLGVVMVDDEGRPTRYLGAHLEPDGAAGVIRRVREPERAIHALKDDLLTQIRETELAFRSFEDGIELRDGKTTRAILVHLELPLRFEGRVSVSETVLLAKTAGVKIVETVSQRRGAPDNRTFIGRGKLDDIVQRSIESDVDLLIFNQELSPGQIKAITEAVEAADLRVIDRTMLILDIFAQRAGSSDGKLQVELAQLRYRLPRLIHKNKAMSRLVHGPGGRGPGEKKLEVDRRRVKDRIRQLERQVDRITSHRLENRKRRNTRGVPVVSFVGYTNAGKSTLLNTITGAEVRAKDELFSTLDPTARRMRFPEERELILTDTVGFIEHLPQALMAAFRATLEEMSEADVLVHVVDITSPRLDGNVAAVARVLDDLDLSETPQILVFNKIDLLHDLDEAYAIAALHDAIPISALDPETTMPLIAAITRLLWQVARKGGEESGS